MICLIDGCHRRRDPETGFCVRHLPPPADGRLWRALRWLLALVC